MNYLQGESLRAAKKAERKGDYLRAGDLYLLAGEEAKGMEMYLKGRDYAQAAKILEEGEHIGAAAHCYAHAGNFERAARLYLRLKDYEKAGFFFEKAGEHIDSSDAWVQAGNLQKAAEVAEKGDRLDRAAALYVRAGDVLKAADLYHLLMVRMGEKVEDPTLMESQRRAIKAFGNAAGSLYSRLQDYGTAADCFMKAGNTQKAANAYQKAQRYEKAAELYVQIEDYHTASQILESINRPARASLLAEKAGEIEYAATLAERAGEIHRAASLYAKAQKLEQAAELYFQLLIESIDRNPADKAGSPLVYRSLAQTCGLLYAQMKQYAKAGWCFERAGDAARAAACYIEGNLNEKAAEMYANLNDYPKAMEFLTKAGDMQNKLLMAKIYFHVGRHEEAAILYMNLEKIDRAAESLEQAGQFLKAAILFEELGQFGKAASLLEKASEHKRAAVLHEQAGEFFEAAQAYESLGDWNNAVRCALQTEDKTTTARLLIKVGKSQDAIALLQSIGSHDLKYREACGLLGELFAQLEMTSLAMQKYSEAVADQFVSGDNIKSYYGLAVAHEKSGNRDAALEIFEKILMTQFDFKDVLARVKELRKAQSPPARVAAPSSEERRAAPSPQQLPERSITLGGPTTEESMGTRIRDYEILDQIGKGATSRIYRARHIYLKMERAIKVIRRVLLDTSSADRFLREAQILGGLRHPNLVELHEFGTLDGGAFFMVLELVAGESAATTVKRDGPLPLRLAIQVIREAAQGLKAAHDKGIIHRDVSPDNLILSQDAEGNAITKVVDFGVAKILQDEATNLTSTISFLGKPQYSSPEQCGFLKEGDSIDGRSDIYSLAVSLHYVLTGSLPFSSPTPQGFLVKHLTQQPVSLADALPNCPECLNRMVLKALSVSPLDRHSGMADFIADLDRV